MLSLTDDGVSALAACLYLNAHGFFVSCGEVADPRLHGSPVGVVAGDPHSDAPMITVNTVAKRAGVRSGERLSDARDRCEGFIARPQRVERYVDVHGRMVEPVSQVLPVATVRSIYELSARLSPWDDSEHLAVGVKSAVAAALTNRVSALVGLAPSAWLAKTEAESNQSATAVVWRSTDLPGVYANLELEDLPGAGHRICTCMRRARTGTVLCLQDAERSRVVLAWGFIKVERGSGLAGGGCPGVPSDDPRERHPRPHRGPLRLPGRFPHRGAVVPAVPMVARCPAGWSSRSLCRRVLWKCGRVLGTGASPAGRVESPWIAPGKAW